MPHHFDPTIPARIRHSRGSSGRLCRPARRRARHRTRLHAVTLRRGLGDERVARRLWTAGSPRPRLESRGWSTALSMEGAAWSCGSAGGPTPIALLCGGRRLRGSIAGSWVTGSHKPTRPQRFQIRLPGQVRSTGAAAIQKPRRDGRGAPGTLRGEERGRVRRSARSREDYVEPAGARTITATGR